MRHLLIALASASAIAVATPTLAQYPGSNGQPGNYQGGYSGVNDRFDERIDQLEERLEDGIDAGTIDRSEARSLRVQIRQLDRLESQYDRDGLDQQERRDLQQRLGAVRQQLRVADGRADRWRGWDRDDGYGQGYGQNQGQNPGWDRGNDRGDRSDRGGRYQEVGEVCSQRTGSAVSAILRNILGADNCLRVGERASTSMSALPSQYRTEFRDGSGYYYRFLDNNVIQVDSRTNVVAKIFDVG